MPFRTLRVFILFNFAAPVFLNPWDKEIIQNEFLIYLVHCYGSQLGIDQGIAHLSGHLILQFIQGAHQN